MARRQQQQQQQQADADADANANELTEPLLPRTNGVNGHHSPQQPPKFSSQQQQPDSTREAGAGAGDDDDDNNNSNEPRNGEVVTTGQHSPPPTITNTQHHMNRNIRLTLVYTFLAFAGRSIWNQSVLATYVYLLTNNNPEAVGLITAVMGICQLIASFPTGYYADKHRRDVMLRIASGVGLLAIGVTMIAIYYKKTNNNTERGHYTILVLALAVWGIFWGIADTALGALFADSITDGQRSYYFAKRSILLNLGNAIGPSMALGMFAFLGDHWTIHDCAIVMTLGNSICLPAVITLAFFNDDDSEVEAVVSSTGGGGGGDSNNNENIDETQIQQLMEPLLLAEEGQDVVVVEDPTATDNHQSRPTKNESSNILFELGRTHQQHQQHQASNESTATASPPPDNIYYCWCITKHRIAPVLVSISDLVSGLASGMSIRYFPIFFLDRLHLSPVQVQILYLVSPLLRACFMKSGQYFAQQYGRCQITLLLRWIGISCMITLILLAHYKYPSWIICVVYVFRTALMNSTSPLTKSLLMDAVPPNERGRWSALESVNMFSWSGSAALGGFLVSFHGLLFNFAITAFIQFLSTMSILTLLLTIKKAEQQEREHEQQQQEQEEEGLTTAITTTAAASPRDGTVSSATQPQQNGKRSSSSSNDDNSPSSVTSPSSATPAADPAPSPAELYEDEDWEDLPPKIRKAYTVLGYTESIWNNDDEDEELSIDDYDWEELTTKQQKAATRIGYTRETWNSG